jgi:O-antigen ligase
MLLEWFRMVPLGSGAIHDCRDALVDLLLSGPDRLWLVIILFVWFLSLLFLEVCRRAEQSEQVFWKIVTRQDWCKLVLIAISVWVYFISSGDVPESGDPRSFALGIDQTTNVLVFLTGMLLSQAVSVLTRIKGRRDAELGWMAIVFFVFLLAIASQIKSEIPHTYQYHADNRSTGPWVNPNIFGLLMGLGAMLAVGGAFQSLKFKVLNLRSGNSGLFKFVFFMTVAGLMTCGLLHSFSRGAWLATACGLLYLTVKSGVRNQEIDSKEQSSFSAIWWSFWLKKNLFPVCLIMFSIIAISFWHFRQTGWRPAHRAFSTVNTADFSWRNRIIAWEGALQITAGHPLLGAGWNQPERLYEEYYLPPKLNEGAAIQMNDYLMLASTLGIPALICFGIYVWWSLGPRNQIWSAEYRIRNLETQRIDWLQTTCHAGAVVLLVGFWFDGGLFKLATASTFWILLELGNVGDRKIHENG